MLSTGPLNVKAKMVSFKKNDILEIQITSLGSSGEGVGHIEGFTVFVDGVLPMELVRVRLSVVKKKYAIASLISIITKSLKRVTPICPLFSRCGGCQIMHLSYEGQLEVKRQKVIDAIERIGHFIGVEVQRCVPSPLSLNYRNKAQLPATVVDKRLQLGFYEKKSHNIVPVDHCYIHCDLGQTAYAKIKKILQNSEIEVFDPTTNQGSLKHLIIKSALHSKESLVILVSSGKEKKKLQEIANEILNECKEVKGVVLNINRELTNTITGDEWICLAGTPYIYETLLGLKFKISPASFFQVNPQQAENLYQKVIEKSGIDSSTRVLDVYCGVGTLSILTAQYAKEVIGIECVKQAIDDAEQNARENNIKNCRFFCGKAENLISNYTNIDVVILNPPRKGCEPEVLASLLKSEPKSILYISCDPATLARDLSVLCKSRYSIDFVQPFDMFPQTMHVETVVKLNFI